MPRVSTDKNVSGNYSTNGSGAEAKAYLEPSEVDLLEQAATNLRDRLLVRVVSHTACRITEALGLEVGDVDLARGQVTIQHLKYKLRLSCPTCGVGLGRRHSYCPGCGARVEEAVTKELERRRTRTLPLDKDTVDMLRIYIERGGPVSRNGKTLVFGINRHRSWQVIRECARRAGLPHLVNPESGKKRGVSPHRLRDSFAVMAMKANDSGDGLRLLQQHLGHANFNTTARYRKIGGQEHRQWYEGLWPSDEDSHAGQ